MCSKLARNCTRSAYFSGPASLKVIKPFVEIMSVLIPERQKTGALKYIFGLQFRPKRATTLYFGLA
jgi:hypothetical protein